MLYIIVRMIDLPSKIYKTRWLRTVSLTGVISAIDEVIHGVSKLYAHTWGYCSFGQNKR